MQDEPLKGAPIKCPIVVKGSKSGDLLLDFSGVWVKNSLKGSFKVSSSIKGSLMGSFEGSFKS